MKKYIKYAAIIFASIINLNVANAAYMNTDAVIRDNDFDVIASVNKGDYVTTYGIDPAHPDRTLISYGNAYGSVLTEYVDEYGYVSNYETSDASNYETSYHDYTIEVSISDQCIYLMDNNSIIKSAECVTGNCGTRDTPCGTFYISNKSQGTYLSGDDYNCYVNYWMAFNGGIGIHDASWRSDFGGDIYMGNGSHGCVNVPYDIAETIYSLCDVGTTVSVY